MREPLVNGPAAVYAAIGVVALARPEGVPELFGGAAPTSASRTEVRAVYGGLPLALAGALVSASRSRGPRRAGILQAVAVASAGMAAGRLAGVGAERELRPWPTGAFMALEAGLAGSLLAALRSPAG